MKVQNGGGQAGSTNALDKMLSTPTAALSKSLSSIMYKLALRTRAHLGRSTKSASAPSGKKQISHVYEKMPEWRLLLARQKNRRRAT